MMEKPSCDGLRISEKGDFKVACSRILRAFHETKVQRTPTPAGIEVANQLTGLSLLGMSEAEQEVIGRNSQNLAVQPCRFHRLKGLNRIAVDVSGSTAPRDDVEACYGLPYRPWFRRAAYLLYLLISFVSMAFGFYDLYKNIPFVKAFVSRLLAQIHIPATAIFEWLELHTQFRLSILLTWLFSRSPLFSSLLHLVRSMGVLLLQLLAPVQAVLAEPLAAALAPITAAFSAMASHLCNILLPLCYTLRIVVTGLCSSYNRMTSQFVDASVFVWGYAAHSLIMLLGPPLSILQGVAGSGIALVSFLVLGIMTL
ncbi:hypothetical protein CEUSTIGMA_g5603.t1 [Chlamydomonas eustigma]|uniref:Uncharacterized protein n=1 Tax=Chlamydomonas eustigma TaxID=1157962 RepID=A0A250X516_9CHLO|nr:hypothetical protein CEUSTIGMA_g5603.t1 [Chlamydomonas eustigma]|eukprot:GAX78161.1 hypothetical protein CEUSTIGMA_g5603.t1 [Chlamydomonas eustigma]